MESLGERDEERSEQRGEHSKDDEVGSRARHREWPKRHVSEVVLRTGVRIERHERVLVSSLP